MARNLFSKLSLEDDNCTNVLAQDPTEPSLTEDVATVSDDIQNDTELVAAAEEAEELLEDINASIAGDKAALVADTPSAVAGGVEPDATVDGDAGVPETAEAVGGEVEVKTIEASQEELKSFYRRAGMSRQQISQESFGRVLLSREAILKEKEDLGSKVGKGVKHWWHDIKETLGAFVKFYPNLFVKYKADKIRALMDEFKAGNIVPKAQLTSQDEAALNDIFGSAGEFGFTLGGDCKDIIEYANAVIDQVDDSKAGSYGSIVNSLKGFITHGQSKNLPKNVESSELFSKLAKTHPEGFSIDPKSDKFITGWIINPFGKQLSLCSIVKDDDLTEKLFFKTQADIIRNTTPAKVVPITSKGIENLLKFGIDSESRIQKLGRSTKIAGFLQGFFDILTPTANLATNGISQASGWARAGTMIKTAAAYNGRALSTLDSKIVKAVKILTEKK